MSKTILITGASTGIGAETARLLATGNEIIVHYNASEEAAKNVASEVERGDGKARLIQADLSGEEGTRALFEFVSSNYDHLDVLVNNAGSLFERREGRDLSWELMEQTFRLNVFSVMTLSSQCIPLLEKGTDPSIINITSIAMRHGAPTATIYGATKGALDSFTRGLAKELAPDIRVNAVAPGVIETPFHERFSTEERMKKFAEATPLKRNGKSEHIATAIRFLIDNDFVTGETVDVN
ncbi:MAG: SDR family oxidoreductase, partial [Balneolaceae bacterium]